MGKGYRYPDSYIIIIAKFLEWRRRQYNNTSRCFTYEGIFSWIKREPMYSDIARTTMERVIRKLAEDGYLDRVRERPRALFCVNRRFIEALKKIVHGAIDHELWE